MPCCLLPALVVFAVSAGVPLPKERFAARVAELVRGLGDDDFDRRQSAQEALVALGPATVPVLESLPPSTDPEVAYRLREVLRLIGGLALELRGLLARVSDQHSSEERRNLDACIDRLVQAHPGAAGDYLLTLVSDRKHTLRTPAANAFVRSWAALSARQVQTFLERTLHVNAAHRSTYPQTVDAMIGVGYRFEYGLGTDPAFRLTTETTHRVDGKPHGKPYRYAHVGASVTTTWVRTKDLSTGRHTLFAETRFEATHRGSTLTGTARSREHSFEVLPAETPDDLACKPDPKLTAQVRAALWFGETEERKDEGEPARDWWKPQYLWKEKDGTPNGLHLPHWRLEKPLPVDLAFQVYLRVGDQDYPADTMVKVAGEIGNLGHVFVQDHRAVARGRVGFVEVRVVLKPSRAAALTQPQVTRYYSSEVVSGPLQMRVGPANSRQ